ncbi:hypothetical protein [Mycolicibacterium palauense]|uniref:hypothetical protein n=1 Tax=Mycolicibacterium palauense TaxID=2034511 RepID=UPI000BFEAC47|nr:hypothetical protein [Mycolicibacterium palauense]
MTGRHPGFRHAAATSWALVGVGVAGTLGASLLAYLGTSQSSDLEVDQGSAVTLLDDAPISRPQTPTSTSVSQSYAPRIHARSFGS